MQPFARTIALIALMAAVPALADEVLLGNADISDALTGKTALYDSSGDEQPFSTVQSTTERLTTNAIVAALSGRTAHFADGDVQTYGADGTTSHQGDTQTLTGTWWAADDQVCQVWAKRGRPTCFALLRQTGGTLVWVGDQGRRFTADMR